ncbi:mandelate racemase/muconate lactonizing enzyme family protein [Pontivivens ytuae]|uniref:Mandelate racemase/muconate lactonizing enzyme family protein n=1 Tax=Pontivivens ytuae TaxID=2789856 RepID=A0A7S9QD86_9RHOB|nr:mandelate racemase/muconate lactonizing enzyme family protein [Pontivivens ytuae]QPH54620.1 mandelate racemase/muconate lactonizing enzyme family protein [Pontivivens ytuae]
MQIKSVEVKAVRIPMSGQQRNARRTWTHKPMLFCFVTAEDGTVGVGEGWTSYASTAALQATIEDDVAPLVVGRTLEEARDLNARVRDACVMSGRYGILAVALSAVEMALWDIRARQEGVPLWQLLGGTSAEVPVYASGGLYAPDKTPERLGEELVSYVQRGHRRVKIKVGGADHDTDVARVAASRAAIGPDVDLYVDAHYTKDEEAAARFADALVPHAVGWFEAPIIPDDWKGHDRLAARAPIPLCGNETLPWRTSFARLAEAGVGYLMPDVSACGGVEETLAVGNIAQEAGAELTLHSSSSAVLFLASLHVAAAHPAAHSVEFHMMHNWFYDLAGLDAVEVVEGRLRIPDRPGLGLDPHALAAALEAPMRGVGEESPVLKHG